MKSFEKVKNYLQNLTNLTIVDEDNLFSCFRVNKTNIHLTLKVEEKKLYLYFDPLDLAINDLDDSENESEEWEDEYNDWENDSDDWKEQNQDVNLLDIKKLSSLMDFKLRIQDHTEFLYNNMDNILDFEEEWKKIKKEVRKIYPFCIFMPNLTFKERISFIINNFKESFQTPHYVIKAEPNDPELDFAVKMAKEKLGIAKYYFKEPKHTISAKIKLGDSGEFVWFSIKLWENDYLIGKLQNIPLYSNYDYNDLVFFDKEDIIDWVVYKNGSLDTPELVEGNFSEQVLRNKFEVIKNKLNEILQKISQ